MVEPRQSSLSARITEQACIYCGHDLAGLTAGDRCPGCGRLTWHSLLGNNLRDADSRWLQGIMRGLMTGTVALPAMALGFVVRGFEAFDPKAYGSDVWFVHALLAMVGWGGLTIGLWMVSEPEQSESLIARRRALAWTMRTALVLTTLAEVVPHSLLTSSSIDPIQIVRFVTAICGPIAFVAMWIYLRRIIARTPRREVLRWLNRAAMASGFIVLLVSRGVDGWLELVLPPAAHLPTRLAIDVVGAAYALLAAFLLLRTRAAVRRTVGFWD